MNKRTVAGFLLFGVLLAGCCASLVAGYIWLVGGFDEPYRPLSLATPGVIYQPNSGKALPKPLLIWQYQESQMLLYNSGSWEWVYAAPTVALYDWRADQAQDLKVPDLRAGMSYSFAQSPDSNLIAYSAHGDIYLFDIAQSQTLNWTAGEYPSFAPDGLRLAFWRNDQLVAKSLDGQVEETLYLPQETATPNGKLWEGGTYSVWSPNGTSIAFESRKLETTNGKTRTKSVDLVVLDLNSQEIIVVDSTTVEEWLSPPSWSPDGRLLAYVKSPLRSATRTLSIVDWRNGCKIGALSLPDIWHPFWSPGGDVIAIGYAGNNYLYFINVEQAFGAAYTDLECPN